MRLFLIGATAAALLGPVALAQSGLDHPCRLALQALMRDWNAIAFPTPSKPAQAHVRGRYGHDVTGGQFTYMQDQIRFASADCDKGNEDAVRKRIAIVRDLLGPESHHTG